MSLTPEDVAQGPEEPLLDEAAEWIARLRAADVRQADREAFSQWLSRSPAHRSAFDSMADLWDGLGAVTAPGIPATPQAAPRPAARPRSERRRWFLGAGALAGTTALLVLAVALLFGPTTYTTGPGDQLQVELDDGSTLELNTRSRVRVTMGRNQRRLDVDVGSEFYLRVAADRDRPFAIHTRHGAIHVIGTELAVYDQEGHTQVTVKRGQVEVAPREMDATHRRRMGAGESLAISTGMPPAELEPAMANRLGWRQGRLVYDQVTLEELITDLNRYLPRRMALMAPELGQERLSAVLHLGHQEAMLESLATILPLKWVAVSDDLIIIHPG